MEYSCLGYFKSNFETGAEDHAVGGDWLIEVLETGCAEEALESEDVVEVGWSGELFVSLMGLFENNVAI